MGVHLLGHEAKAGVVHLGPMLGAVDVLDHMGGDAQRLCRDSAFLAGGTNIHYLEAKLAGS